MQFPVKPSDLSPSSLMNLFAADCWFGKCNPLRPRDYAFPSFFSFSRQMVPPNDTLVCSSVSWRTTDTCCREAGCMFDGGVIRNSTTGMEGACLGPEDEEAWRECVRRVQAQVGAGVGEQQGAVGEQQGAVGEQQVVLGQQKQALAGEQERASQKTGDAIPRHDDDRDHDSQDVKAECTPWAAFLTGRLEGASENEERIETIFQLMAWQRDLRTEREVSLDEVVVYSTLDLDYLTSSFCCEWAAEQFPGPGELWYRQAILGQSETPAYLDQVQSRGSILGMNEEQLEAAFNQRAVAAACMFRKDQAEEWDLYNSWWTKCVQWARNYPVHLRNIKLVSRNSTAEEMD